MAEAGGTLENTPPVKKPIPKFLITRIMKNREKHRQELEAYIEYSKKKKAKALAYERNCAALANVREQIVDFTEKRIHVASEIDRVRRHLDMVRAHKAAVNAASKNEMHPTKFSKLMHVKPDSSSDVLKDRARLLTIYQPHNSSSYSNQHAAVATGGSRSNDHNRITSTYLSAPGGQNSVFSYAEPSGKSNASPEVNRKMVNRPGAQVIMQSRSQQTNYVTQHGSIPPTSSVVQANSSPRAIQSTAMDKGIKRNIQGYADEKWSPQSSTDEKFYRICNLNDPNIISPHQVRGVKTQPGNYTMSNRQPQMMQQTSGSSSARLSMMLSQQPTHSSTHTSTGSHYSGSQNVPLRTHHPPLQYAHTQPNIPQITPEHLHMQQMRHHAAIQQQMMQMSPQNMQAYHQNSLVGHTSQQGDYYDPSEGSMRYSNRQRREREYDYDFDGD